MYKPIYWYHKNAVESLHGAVYKPPIYPAADESAAASAIAVTGARS